jgi:glucosyl-3-phosphoglycerate synthase
VGSAGDLRRYAAGVSPTDRQNDAAAWFKRRTISDSRPDPAAIADLKRQAGATVAVGLPVLNEAATLPSICEALRSTLVERAALVDEIVVIDSGSSDGSADLARAAAADVYLADRILPEVGSRSGKGEALWKSLAVLKSDIVVWLDSDISNFDPTFVTKLVAPLLVDESIVYTKGFYRRPITEGGSAPSVGGRVTELAIRPMLNLLWPQLAGFVQPLAGEYAGRRDVLVQLPFFTGYAVEVGLLLDIVERFGLDSIAQVDLGVRLHRQRDTLALGRTAHEIMHALLVRLEAAGRIRLTEPLVQELVQFVHGADGLDVIGSLPEVSERPPMASVLNDFLGTQYHVGT